MDRFGHQVQGVGDTTPIEGVGHDRPVVFGRQRVVLAPGEVQLGIDRLEVEVGRVRRVANHPGPVDGSTGLDPFRPGSGQ